MTKIAGATRANKGDGARAPSPVQAQADKLENALNVLGEAIEKKAGAGTGRFSGKHSQTRTKTQADYAARIELAQSRSPAVDPHAAARDAIRAAKGLTERLRTLETQHDGGTEASLDEVLLTTIRTGTVDPSTD